MTTGQHLTDWYSFVVSSSSRRKSERHTEQDDRLDAVFTALADPTRRRILAHLSQGPTTVSAIAEPFVMTLPAVSKHLRVLERAGVVRSERDGRFVRCRLEAAPLSEASAFLARYRPFWQDTLDQLAEYLEKPVGKHPEGKKKGTR
jgi:DNA-binding transcriptional ArsR family regulator